MKNVSTLNGKLDSPKTPGGISKSLLTPCRRVGLSRNWKKSGPSPFVSPLAGTSEVQVEKSEPRKRKKRDYDEDSTAESFDSPVSRNIDTKVDDCYLTKELAPNIEDVESTPTRNISTYKRKKSKTLLSARIVNHDNIEDETLVQSNKSLLAENNTSLKVISNVKSIKECKEDIKDVVTPVRSKSKSKVIINKPAVPKSDVCIEVKENISVNKNIAIEPNKKVATEQKSPDNLTKECIVVIQKKIFKKDMKSIEKDRNMKDKKTNSVSQALFDSDSDDVPLIALNKNEVKAESSNAVIVLDDDDFDETCKVKVKKLVDKTTSIGGLKPDSNNKKKCKEKLTTLPQKSKTKVVEPKVCSELKTSQSSLDDDDFVIDNRKTILIRKSYDKVTKPSKAKSTGSITQKDIDELKARIEMKKKLLLAKAVSEDTEELRDLIKKWQKGCQDALMELMELMKNKFPDKQNMDYSEMLQTLKIPSALVGYDEDNDCFNTPTDEYIILSKFDS